MVLGADIQEDTQPQAAVLSQTEQTTNDELLIPLGAQGNTGDEGSSTQIYIGNDEEVVRPIERPNKDGSYWVTDATGRRKRVFDDKPEVSDKTRMLRAALAGGLMGMAGTIVMFLVKKHVPEVMLVLPIGDVSNELSSTFAGALQYGFYSAVLFGGILGLVMVHFKLGIPVGIILGALLGFVSCSMATENCMPFPLITGVVAGIVTGYFSTKGMKKIVSV